MAKTEDEDGATIYSDKSERALFFRNSELSEYMGSSYGWGISSICKDLGWDDHKKVQDFIQSLVDEKK